MVQLKIKKIPYNVAIGLDWFNCQARRLTHTIYAISNYFMTLDKYLN